MRTTSKPPSVEQLRLILQEWAVGIVREGVFDEVFLFGSLLNLGGAGFKPYKSDIDLVLKFSSIAVNPVSRAEACRKALKPKQALERTLEGALGRSAATVPIISAVAATGFECENDIHKGKDPRFFSVNRFLALINSDTRPKSLASPAGDLFAIVYPDAVPAISTCQYYRNKYLAITSGGKCNFPDYDDKEDPLPKEMCRHAARLSDFVRNRNTEDGSQFDPLKGLDYLYELVCDLAPKQNAYAELRELFVARRVQGAVRKPIDAFNQLLLWEILADNATAQILARQKRLAISLSSVSPGPPQNEPIDSERRFIELAAKPSIRFAGLELKCKLLPEELWGATRTEHKYEDNSEADRQIVLEWKDENIFPTDLLTKLLSEIERRKEDAEQGRITITGREIEDLTQVLRTLKKEGSNAYPRLVGVPFFSTNKDGQVFFHIPIGPSRFGVALIEERRLGIPTAVALRSRHILNSLAVRVAYVYKKRNRKNKSQRWIEFHQRKASTATYKLAWDVGAAGYIDPDRHKPEEAVDQVSPWFACANELVEELNIPAVELPNREHYFFFGLGRNDPTGQLDLLAYCDSPFVPNPNRAKRGKYVKGFGRCLLTPKSVATFVASKGKWVPTAILTLILTLEAVGFAKDEIEYEFEKCKDLDLEP
jgi:hypothetical protein